MISISDVSSFVKSHSSLIEEQRSKHSLRKGLAIDSLKGYFYPLEFTDYLVQMVF